MLPLNGNLSLARSISFRFKKKIFLCISLYFSLALSISFRLKKKYFCASPGPIQLVCKVTYLGVLWRGSIRKHAMTALLRCDEITFFQALPLAAGCSTWKDIVGFFFGSQYPSYIWTNLPHKLS